MGWRGWDGGKHWHLVHSEYKKVKIGQMPLLKTIAPTKEIVSFAEANEISIGPKAVRLHWPVLPDCWSSVELVEIPIEICTVGAVTALPDQLLILLAFFDTQQV